MMMIGRRNLLGFVAGLLCGLPVIAAAQSYGSPQVLRIATASKAGTFYPIGSLIAEGITGTAECTDAAKCGVLGVIAVAQVSNGSVANVEAISAGAIEAALAQADVIYWAYNAEGRFAGQEPRTKLRAVANLFPGSLHIVTSAGSGIEKVEDLRGKRVALDEPGSGTLATAELILNSVGNRQARPLAALHQAQSCRSDADRGRARRLLLRCGVSDRVGARRCKDDRYQARPAVRPHDRQDLGRPAIPDPGVIPAGAYPNVSEDVPTLDIGTQLIVNADADPDLVYRMTKALWSDRTRKLLDEGHPKGSQVRLETALKGIAIPLHEGAARFYREAGLLKE